ncbi:uncharacterized protein LOC116261046 isoform X2 [Nymphaea colorata]|uniref:uncharacterized protein LOC116261046 isoform X2 n=1 Tax=Nymphaea colorata TaxID=210225 RepID=UPI00129E945C|nr:uncharacterized protein LOC116261046 isoform X2 [Nymphaea colorata]
MGGKGKTSRQMEKKSLWPEIKTKSHLKATFLKDSHLFTVQDFLTAAESKSFIQAADSVGFVHQGSLGPAKGEAYRDNDRISVEDPILAEKIWKSGLDKLFNGIEVQGRVAVGLNPNIRFYRYKVGQRFGPHIDESIDLEGGHSTEYTLLVYLNGTNSSTSNNQNLVGGETVFYDSRKRIVAEVAPAEGMALLHLHGEKCMLHEARIVKKSVKYVLRSDVVFA